MARDRRIVPVSSGKGGVGKTTFALNFALSLAEHGTTVLIDLDTGTSSLRACLDTPIQRDLYHFFRKGHRLDECITSLDRRLDPRGHFSRFGFVAGPRHLIEDITNFDRPHRERLIDAINALDARFVVLDLKAGLDAAVVDFLPYSNSGILLFTPHLPAATLAASDIVKAILFRKLRTIFAPGSPVYAQMGELSPGVVAGLIDRVEDVYEPGTHNLDAFVEKLRHLLGEHPVVDFVAGAVDSFVVHYVLNRFNGVQGSFDAAVRPFLEGLAENVSEHMTVLNLGWIVEHEAINRANTRRVPVLLAEEEGPAPAEPDRAQAELAELASRYLGPAAGRAKLPARRRAPRPDPAHYLHVQLDAMTRMFEDTSGADYRENFRYVAHRALHVARSRPVGDLGDSRLYKQSEIQQLWMAKGR